MATWTETEPREYTATLGTYTLNVRLSLFGGAAYIVRLAWHVLGKEGMPTVRAAIQKAEEIAAMLKPDRTPADVAP